MEHHHQQGETPSWKFKTRLQHCEIWEHNIHRTVVEAYPIANYERAYSKINRNKVHIVSCLGTVIDNRSNQPYLLIERIPNRFSEVATLTEPQTLKILFAVFRGLEELQEIYGIVGLNESCICFNGLGKVKIWVNPDLSSLHPILVLKEHCSNENKIIYNIQQVIKMVERKCFNSSFLEPFIRKLGENKITDYRQAADQILKIGELLFIVVEEKPIHIDTLYKPKFQNLETGNYSKKVNPDFQQAKPPRKQCIQGHNRKFSNHQTINETNHRRYQSFVEPHLKKEPQPAPFLNLALNFNKLAQSQAMEMLAPQLHKSAPLSPREDTKRSHNKNSSQLKENIQKMNVQLNRAPAFQKKQENKSIFYGAVQEETGQFDDSFSQNLKVDDKEILVSGDFQTFGILQDLTDSCNKKKKHRKTQNFTSDGGQHSQNEPDYDYDFDIGKMDLQIQKRLEKRVREERQRTSIRGSLEVNQQRTEHKPRAKQKTLPFDSQKQKENLMGGFVSKREKSPQFSYIDQKYQQYIRKTQKEKSGEMTTQRAGVKHKGLSEHMEESPAYRCTKTSPNSNHCWPSMMVKNAKQSYRIPTDR